MGEEDRFLLGVILYSGVLAAICAMIVWAIACRMHPRRNQAAAAMN